MTCQGSKVKTRQDHDFFQITMQQIQKFEMSFFVVALLSVVPREQKIIMSIAEEEREGQGSNEPTREQCLLDATGCLYTDWQQRKLVIARVLCIYWKAIALEDRLPNLKIT